MATREQLFSITLDLYSEKGGKFTMDEVAARLLISKKTLYEMVKSKEDLAVQLIKFYFDQVAEKQQLIHEDQSLSNIDKLHQLLCATPDFPMQKYHLNELKMTLPAAFEVLDMKLRLGWEKTMAVIEKAKADGSIRPIDNSLFIKLYSAAIEELLGDNLIHDERTFKQKQAEIVDILLFGITSTT